MELDRIIALSNTVTVYRDGDRCVKVFDAHLPIIVEVFKVD